MPRRKLPLASFLFIPLFVALACSDDAVSSDASIDGAVPDASTPDASGDGALPDAEPGDGALPDASTGPLHDCTPNRFVTVDADGSGDGSSDRPWTLAQAMADAAPGDVVVVGPGVYTAPSTSTRYTPAWNPARSGTSGMPIVFCAEYPAVHNDAMRSELRNDAAGESDGASPTFGAQDREHIVWDGFYVDEASSPSTADTGPVVVWGSRHVTIARSVIDGATISRADNHNGIRMEAVENVLITQNRISGVRDVMDRPNRNHSAIMTYDASFVTIEHNEISDCEGGMYLKGDHADDGFPNGAYTVRFNRIHDVEGTAITVLGVIEVGGRPSEVSHNVVERSGIGVLFNSVGDDHPAAVRVHHNTIVSTGAAFFPNANTLFDFHVYENLAYDVGQVFLIESLDEAGLRTVIGNGYFSDDNHAHMHGEWAVGRSLGDWQSYIGLDLESSTGDPGFVDVDGGDYRLATDAAARTASVSGAPVGAFVTGDEVVGIEAP